MPLFFLTPLFLHRDLTFFLNTNVDRVVELQESSQDLFLKLENSLMVKNYKLGVLSWNCRQKTEDEIFANTVISPDFREFLDFLGEVVTLEGWPYYRAGLDVKANTTGEQSLFTRYLDYEVFLFFFFLSFIYFPFVFPFFQWIVLFLTENFNINFSGDVSCWSISPTWRRRATAWEETTYWK